MYQDQEFPWTAECVDLASKFSTSQCDRAWRPTSGLDLALTCQGMDIRLLWVVRWSLRRSNLFRNTSQSTLRPGKFGGQVDALSSLSCPLNHSREVLYSVAGCVVLWGVPLPSGSAVAMTGWNCSATVFGRMVRVKRHPHQCQEPRFPRTMLLT